MPIPITGTPGDDTLTGTYGSDIFHPGGSLYGDTINDPGGDDFYVLESGYSFINDGGGTDTVTIEGYGLADLNFFIIFDTTVAIWTDDYAIGAWFENMTIGSAYGIENLVLDDITLTRDQILTLASGYFG